MKDPPRCTYCQQQLYANDETFASLAGGVCGDRSRSGLAAPTFLDLCWRSPFSQGEGETLELLSLIDETPRGQFEVYFCSTACLRSYLNSKVDQLESLAAEWYRQRVLAAGAHRQAVTEWQSFFGSSAGDGSGGG